LASRRDVTEKKMFGGLAFLVRGNMCCGVVGERLMVRVGPAAYEAALSQPHAGEMNFTGRPMKGFVYVEPEGVESDRALRKWVARATGFVLELPPK
jgi:TfoX/Sxy family transcriptional regulator of competence genes